MPSREMRKTSPKSSASPAIGRDITQTNVPKIRKKSQKTNIDLGNLKNGAQVQALVDSDSKVNAIHPTFAKQLGFSIRPTDVEIQKTDNTILNTHEMVVATFSVVDKANQVKFFEETFLVTNVSPEVVLGMPFVTLSGANVDFLG